MFKHISLRTVFFAAAVALTTIAAHAARQAAPPSVRQPVPPAPAGGEALAPLPMPDILKQYQLVSADRLTNPVDGLDNYQEMMRLLVEEKSALKVYVNVAEE